MPKLMAGADFAISGCGGTLWEMLFLQVPVYGIVTADNQVQNVDQLAMQGSILLHNRKAGRFAADAFLSDICSMRADFQLRRALAAHGRKLVPGNGARLLMKALKRMKGV